MDYFRQKLGGEVLGHFTHPVPGLVVNLYLWVIRAHVALATVLWRSGKLTWKAWRKWQAWQEPFDSSGLSRPMPLCGRVSGSMTGGYTLPDWFRVTYL